MKDRKISELFEKSMQWIEETGGSIEEAASQFPLYQEDLLDMLKTKGKLDQTTHPNPRPEFKAVARTRLLNQIQAENKTSQNQSVTKHQPLRQILQNYNLIRRLSMTWIIILGILVATFTGGGSVALASIDALPGDSPCRILRFSSTVIRTILIFYWEIWAKILKSSTSSPLKTGTAK